MREASGLLLEVEEILKRDFGGLAIGSRLLDPQKPLRMGIGRIAEKKLPRRGQNRHQRSHPNRHDGDHEPLEYEATPHRSTLSE
jgi:hypothetical protein